MKHNWEYKRLGDVCEVNFGQRIVAKDTEPGQYFVYGGGGATFTTQKYNREDCMIVSRFAMSKECVRFVKGKFFLNDSGLSVKSDYRPLSQTFLDKYLWSIQSLIYNLGRGVAQKNLNTKAFENISIPVPPMEVQERIVAELDHINDLIAKNRELLSQLDSLAQSIFYDTFGDPITNPKGWETKTIGEVSKVLGGSTPKTNVDEYWNGDFPWITPAELKGTKYIYDTERHISESGRASSGLQMLPINTVLLTSRAPIGKVAIIKKPMFCNQGFKNLICDDKYIHFEFAYFFLSLITDVLNEKGTGATFKEISKKVTESISIPVPPLALQEAFAEKVEAIDAQKAKVEAEIAELQTLLDARMDFWFN